MTIRCAAVIVAQTILGTPIVAAFIDRVPSDEGQAAIAGYRVDGRRLFFPDAGG
jgi:ABC-type tungstate transport system permease subunit